MRVLPLVTLVAAACASEGGHAVTSGSKVPDSGAAGTGNAQGGSASSPAAGSVSGGAAGTVSSSAGGGLSGGAPSSSAGASTGGTSSSGGNQSAGGASNGGASSSGGSAGAQPAGATFTTSFDLTESPLSEHGAWTNAGIDWTFVLTNGGFAFGSQTGNDGYNDSYAHLSGFPPNQTATATIHLESGITASYNEVEILLRWTDSPHHATGYECNLAHDGSYAQIIRWPGKIGTGLNDFVFLANGTAPSGVHDGDVLSASVVGNTITSYLNGKVLVSATDSTITSGNPGIGFYWEKQAGSKMYSFSSFTAKGLP